MIKMKFIADGAWRWRSGTKSPHFPKCWCPTLAAQFKQVDLENIIDFSDILSLCHLFINFGHIKKQKVAFSVTNTFLSDYFLL